VLGLSKRQNMENHSQNKLKLEALLDVLKHPDLKIQMEAILELENFLPEPKVEETLLLILKDKNKNPFVRSQVVLLLGKIKTERSIDQLIEIITDEEDLVGEKAKEKIISLAANSESFVIEALIKILNNKNKTLRFWAADTLGYYVTSNRVVDILIEKLRNGNDEEREAVAYALGYYNGSKIVASLIDALRDQNSEVRYYSVTGLGEIGNNSAIPALKELYQKELVERVKEVVLVAIRNLEQLEHS